MKTLAWIGAPFFAPSLPSETWTVRFYDPPPGEVLTWESLCAAIGASPDMVVLGDKSLPPLLAGMERFPCLTVFYAVDTHIHSWYPFYGQAFDLVLVSLKDHMPLFVGQRLAPEQIRWFPPYARDDDAPAPRNPELPVWDLLFVGTVDPARNAERSRFMRELAALFPGLHAQAGNYKVLFHQGRLLLNHAAQNDLNFRVFEALGCGGCLLTPRVGHGLEDLFTHGQELFIYDQDDIPGLAALARMLLQEPERRAAVAAKGLAAVDTGHRARHRAAAFTELAQGLFRSGAAQERIRARLEQADAIHERYLRFMYLLHADTAPTGGMKKAYLEAARKSPVTR